MKPGVQDAPEQGQQSQHKLLQDSKAEKTLKDDFLKGHLCKINHGFQRGKVERVRGWTFIL